MDTEIVDSPPTGTPSRRRWIAGAIVGLALVHPIASLLSGLDWRADLLSHFQEPAVLVSLLAFGVLIRRRPRLAVVFAALAVLQAGNSLRYEWSNPVPPDPASSERLRFLVANVLFDNDRYEELAGLIAQENPDIVGLVEYTHEWQKGLWSASASYPYRVEAPAGSKGLALWFRERPLVAEPPATLRSGAWPTLHAKISLGGRPCDLWLVHPHSPVRSRGMESGNPELAALADRVGQTPGPRIVMGDMNTTDGSANFTAFLKRTGLRDSRLGFGRQGSFPTFFPYRIAIDHALVSPEIAVVERRLGPNVGSDHFPLIFEVAPAAGARNADTQHSQSAAE